VRANGTVLAMVCVVMVSGCSSKKHGSNGPSDAAVGGDAQVDGAAMDSSEHTGADGGDPGTGGGNNDAAAVEADGGTTVMPDPAKCVAFGAICKHAADCCSGLCDAATNTCSASTAQCSASGSSCVSATECCSLGCISGQCSDSTCMSDAASCTIDSECCSGKCDQGQCGSLNPSCKTSGNECTSNDQCCSQLCDGGHCSLSASFCVQQGDVCSRDMDCCSSACTKADGAQLGICAEPPSGAANCSGQVDGTVCNGCGSCCSRLCAPYKDTGVSVCQPASGCHPTGGLCREDADCCGSSGTGLPGDGNVRCEKDSGAAVGICRNPTGCNPQGNVCHYKNYTCSISSARNDCCAAPGNSGVCQLDRLGVPRCNGLGETCRMPSDTCASSDDCCDDRPCVADTIGVLRCYKSNTGDPSCVSSGGSCTVTGDCCRGTSCITELGSTRGSCSAPPAAGSGGSTAAGSGGAGGAAGGGAGASGSPAAGSGGTYQECAQFGQHCVADTDCCSGIPCFGGTCTYNLL
jgi:hypothetical protein